MPSNNDRLKIMARIILKSCETVKRRDERGQFHKSFAGRPEVVIQNVRAMSRAVLDLLD